MTVVLDNSIYAFGYEPDNGIPITSWFDDKKDTELKTILPYLRELTKEEDVRKNLDKKYGIREKIRSFRLQPTYSVCNKHTSIA